MSEEKRTDKEIIDDWALPLMNPWFPIDGRLELIIALMATFKAEGHTRKDVSSASVRKQIIDYTVNKKSKKYKTWKSMVEMEIDRAIVQVFGKPVVADAKVDSAIQESAKKLAETAAEAAKERVLLEHQGEQAAKDEIDASRYRKYVPNPENLKVINDTFKFGPGDDEDII
jgi:hypothetical protein